MLSSAGYLLRTQSAWRHKYVIFQHLPCFDVIVSHHYTAIDKNERHYVLFLNTPLWWIMSTSGKYGPLYGLGKTVPIILCLSLTKLLILLFKYCIVIIKKVEMFYVVLNIVAC